MAESGPTKKRSRLGARFQLEINFPDEDSKILFLGRLDVFVPVRILSGASAKRSSLQKAVAIF